MYCIKHLIHINVESENVYNALTTIDGLSNWWTNLTSGLSKLNGIIEFRFNEPYFMRMKVIELEKNKKVLWQCIEAEKDWIGTLISFELESQGNKTILRFKHDAWPTHSDFFAHCNLSWAKYLISLRDYLQTGKGRPFSKLT
jgi:uncharacterized protein YndB with AHSA1/START domain